MTTSSTFSLNPLGYEGIDINSVANVLPIASRIPTTNDVQPYGTIWPYNGTSPVTLYISEGAGNWGTFVIPSGDLLTLTGNSGTATPSSNNITLSGGTTGLVATGSGATITLSGTLAVANGGTGAATLTSHGVLLGAGTSAVSALAAAATGSVLMGVTGANPAFTGSPSFSGSVTAGTTITATSGAITATNGNLVTTAAGTGLLLNPGTISGTTTATLNARVGQITITTPSIAGGAVFAFTLTNSAIAGASTQVGYWLTGGTTGSALTIQSYANTASQSVITINNGTGATTNAASLILNFLVLN